MYKGMITIVVIQQDKAEKFRTQTILPVSHFFHNLIERIKIQSWFEIWAGVLGVKLGVTILKGVVKR